MGQDLAKQVQPRNSVHSNSSVVQAPQPKDLYSKKGPLNRCKCARLSHFYVIDIKCHPWESAQKYHCLREKSAGSLDAFSLLKFSFLIAIKFYNHHVHAYSYIIGRLKAKMNNQWSKASWHYTSLSKYKAIISLLGAKHDYDSRGQIYSLARNLMIIYRARGQIMTKI